MRQPTRKFALCVAPLLISLIAEPEAHAQTTYRTRDGYVGCISRADFNEQTSLLVSGDRVAWAGFIQNSSCVILRAGVEVYMENAPGLGVIKIRRRGSTVWIYTNTEAIRR
jgi:hypothetical protein